MSGQAEVVPPANLLSEVTVSANLMGALALDLEKRHEQEKEDTSQKMYG